MRIKTVNGLMKYLREQKGIAISGSSQKQKLRSIGYYHGYKGYRFFNTPSNTLAYSDFNQLLSVYAFDMRLKTLLYTPLMQIETALKNYALEEILSTCNSNLFTDVFAMMFNHHNDYPKSSRDYKETLKKELALRNKVYGNLSRDYTSKLVIRHFIEKDLPVPIWAIFETISLGEFGTMLACLNNQAARQISSMIGINTSFNVDGRLLEKIVFPLKDLRNAVAHNDPIFDVRFKAAAPNMNVARLLSQETGIQSITFNNIVDYVILVVYLMKKLGFTKTEAKQFIGQFRDSYEELRKAIPIQLFSKIIPTDTRAKLNQLQNFL